MRQLSKKEEKKMAKQVYKTDEQNEIKKFIIILLIVGIIVVAAYFLTRIFVTKDLLNQDQKEKTEAVFDYNITIVGSMLNRPYDEYYVLAYSSKSPEVNYYAGILSRYQEKEDSLKIYVVDLNDSMNSSYYSKDETNPEAKNIEDLKLGDFTLIKVKNKQISKYLESADSIKAELGL